MTIQKSSTPEGFDLETLARSIQTVSDELARQASRSVNVCLTVRNWLIGHYIAEFELNGSDRAAYGDKLLDRLANRLTDLSVPTCDKRRLYQYLRFFQTYPEIVRSLPAQSRKLLLPQLGVESLDEKVRSLTAQSKMNILEALSYTHLELLVGIDDPRKRAFYRGGMCTGRLVGSRTETPDS